MKTDMVDGKPITKIRPEAKRKLLHVIGKLAPYTKTPALGCWKRLSDEELWNHIISQVCVMGSAVPMEKLHSAGNRRAFELALSLSTLSTKQNKFAYIESQLKKFKATRFRNRAARRLAAALANPSIVKGTRVVLLEDLPRGDPGAIREEILRRSESLFKRKSVSDLMISVGISHDVVALDQRVVGMLNTHLGYNRKFSSLQASRKIYLSVENCLRGVCKEANVTLGTLDRMLFGFAGLTAMEYLMGYDLPTSTTEAL